MKLTHYGKIKIKYMEKINETFIEYKPENGFDGCKVYHNRLNFYHKLGKNQIPQDCEIFGYDPYIEHVLTSDSDLDLYKKDPKSWEFVRNTLLPRHERRGNRTCFATAKDILMDGLVTDVMQNGFKNYCPELKIEKSNQDSKLSLISNATLEPDFKVYINGMVYLVEMKIANDREDSKGRKKWSGTFTIRTEYDEVNRELLRYSKYNKPIHPLLFLRINPKDNYVAVIAYDKFIKSKSGDGTYYAHYRPRIFNNLESLIKIINEEIRKEINDIQKWKK